MMRAEGAELDGALASRAAAHGEPGTGVRYVVVEGKEGLERANWLKGARAMMNRIYGGEEWWIESTRSRIDSLYAQGGRDRRFVLALADDGGGTAGGPSADGAAGPAGAEADAPLDVGPTAPDAAGREQDAPCTHTGGEGAAAAPECAHAATDSAGQASGEPATGEVDAAAGGSERPGEGVATAGADSANLVATRGHTGETGPDGGDAEREQGAKRRRREENREEERRRQRRRGGPEAAGAGGAEGAEDRGDDGEDNRREWEGETRGWAATAAATATELMRRAATGLNGLWQRVRGKRDREEEADEGGQKKPRTGDG